MSCGWAQVPARVTSRGSGHYRRRDDAPTKMSGHLDVDVEVRVDGRLGRPFVKVVVDAGAYPASLLTVTVYDPVSGAEMFHYQQEVRAAPGTRDYREILGKALDAQSVPVVRVKEGLCPR